MLEEFDASLLKKLTEEGNVFILERNAYVREILDYVNSIRDYATDLWQEEVDDLWQTILNDEYFSEFLTMKKGKQAGHMNRYAVTNLVCRMQNNGIYRDDVPMLTLHLCLEGTTKKNKYYSNFCNYVPSKDASDMLKQLFSKF